MYVKVIEDVKINVLEMKCLRSLVGVSRIDRVRNEKVRRRAEIERELASRADQRILRWFGHVERMDEYRMARGVLMVDVSGGRLRGRPRLGWMDGLKVALGKRRKSCIEIESCNTSEYFTIVCRVTRTTWCLSSHWWHMESLEPPVPHGVCQVTGATCSLSGHWYHMESVESLVPHGVCRVTSTTWSLSSH